MTHSAQVKIYDTTLRDGTQREGISLSLADKIKIALRLDDFGVHYIEGGWPGSNPKDAEFFEAVQHMNFKHAKIAAFGATRKKNCPPQDDPNIQALQAANTPVVTLVGKSWDLHVRVVLEVDPEENLAMISESVTYFKDLGKEVIYDAEHFFDGYKANPEYALLTLRVAAEAGADCVVLCDTNGGSLPWEIGQIVGQVRDALKTAGLAVALGIHTHDDGGCGVANSLAAVQAGAVQVQGTINGYGERVGNANLCTVIPDLHFKMGRPTSIPADRLPRLTELSHFVAELANLPHDDHQPYTGQSAFAHKGGIHVAAMRKNPASYQHIDPAAVGNLRRTVVSELSGRGNVLDKAAEFGLDVNSADVAKTLERIKALENQGFSFESAEASIALMLIRLKPGYTPPFELIDFTVLVQHRLDRGIFADASVKVKIGNQVFHTAGEGNGPVNALNVALRKALHGVYPQLEHVHLADYKVRILDSDHGTAARVRVLIDSQTDWGQVGAVERWSTVGASSNIIEASWHALTDSMEFALLNGR